MSEMEYLRYKYAGKDIEWRYWIPVAGIFLPGGPHEKNDYNRMQGDRHYLWQICAVGLTTLAAAGTVAAGCYKAARLLF